MLYIIESIFVIANRDYLHINSIMNEDFLPHKIIIYKIDTTFL